MKGVERSGRKLF